MGTNYYATIDTCPECERGEEIHIGKSSGGWCFSLHVYPENEEWPKDLNEWRALWMRSDVAIKDEYGKSIPPAEMDRTVTARGREERASSGQLSPGWYELNSAIPGPANLTRHAIDGHNCIGHGTGTWDLIVGEFS